MAVDTARVGPGVRADDRDAHRVRLPRAGPDAVCSWVRPMRTPGLAGGGMTPVVTRDSQPDADGVQVTDALTPSDAPGPCVAQASRAVGSARAPCRHQEQRARVVGERPGHAWRRPRPASPAQAERRSPNQASIRRRCDDPGDDREPRRARASPFARSGRSCRAESRRRRWATSPSWSKPAGVAARCGSGGRCRPAEVGGDQRRQGDDGAAITSSPSAGAGAARGRPPTATAAPIGIPIAAPTSAPNRPGANAATAARAARREGERGAARARLAAPRRRARRRSRSGPGPPRSPRARCRSRRSAPRRPGSGPISESSVRWEPAITSTA